MPGPVFLDGERVSLHPPTESDLDFLARNRNDPRIRAGRTAPYPTGRGGVKRFLGGRTGRNDQSLGLVACVDGERVGFVILNREKLGDDVYRRGELAYWVAPDAQGNGYATAASRLLVAHAFADLGLHKLTAKAFAENAGSRRVIEKLGFTEEGRLRREALVDGEWQDYVRYGLLREEWTDGD